MLDRNVFGGERPNQALNRPIDFFTFSCYKMTTETVTEEPRGASPTHTTKPTVTRTQDTHFINNTTNSDNYSNNQSNSKSLTETEWIELTNEPLDAMWTAVMEFVRDEHAGATATFTGTTRATFEGDISTFYFNTLYVLIILCIHILLYII